MSEGAAVNFSHYAGKDLVHAIFKEASRVAFHHHAKIPDVVISEDVGTNAPVFGHWMSLILLASPELRMTFKVFFDSTKVKKIASKALNVEVGKVTSPIVADFMREFANVAAGSAKRTLFELDIAVGLSLPLVTRGFDEVFSKRGNYGTDSVSNWKLEATEGFLYCSAVIQILDEQICNELKWVSKEKTDDMEFL